MTAPLQGGQGRSVDDLRKDGTPSILTLLVAVIFIAAVVWRIACS